MEPPSIATPRLLIRPHEPGDLEPFIEFMTDPNATMYMSFDESQKTPEGARQLLEYVIASYETDDPVFALAIVDNETDAYLGSCGLSPLGEGGGVECYYSLLPRYWGWGFASEAMMGMLYYAFEELELPRVVAHMNRKNFRAWSVARNVGMRHEGPCEHAVIPDCERFSIRREDWVARVERDTDTHPSSG